MLYSLFARSKYVNHVEININQISHMLILIEFVVKSWLITWKTIHPSMQKSSYNKCNVLPYLFWIASNFLFFLFFLVFFFVIFPFPPYSLLSPSLYYFSYIIDFIIMHLFSSFLSHNIFFNVSYFLSSILQKLFKWFAHSQRQPGNQDQSLSAVCGSAGITEALLAKVRECVCVFCVWVCVCVRVCTKVSDWVCILAPGCVCAGVLVSVCLLGWEDHCEPNYWGRL